MTRSASLLLVTVWLAGTLLHGADRPPRPGADGQRIANFRLKDGQDREITLASFQGKKAVVVVFLGTECPLVSQYMSRLSELAGEFGPQGVAFLGVNSNVQDPAERVAEHARQHKATFPVVKDAGNRVADVFQAERTPEAFVLDTTGRVLYRGRIDDQYGIGYQRPQPQRRDLAEALKEILAGRPVSVVRTEAPGCIIAREKAEKATGTVTYAKDVARILQNHCQECHRPGQIGPFSLMTYDKAKAWSDTIKEVVVERRMPPWHADPKYGHFSNDRSLPAEAREKLLAWIDQGCPKGDDKDLPPPRDFKGTDGWTIGKPDLIFTMLEDFKVPAKAPRGGVPYQHFMVPTDLKEDVWVQAVEAMPGNRAVVHHILVYVLEPGKRFEPRSEDALGRNFLVGTAPGDMPGIFAPGKAKRIPKGSTLLFQMHYTPNGTEQTDRSSVGLILAKEPPQHVVRTRTPLARRFAIPPGDDNHRVVCSTTFQRDAVLLSFMPHMHLRGKDFEYKAVYPDGRTEILLSVPRYDFGWQTMYRLAQPLNLPKGTKIECVAHFDNSEKNPNNPDPTKTVYWGDQTWEEMMIGWMDYYYVDEKPDAKADAGG